MLAAAWVEMAVVCRSKLKAANPDLHAAQHGLWGCLIAGFLSGGLC